MLPKFSLSSPYYQVCVQSPCPIHTVSGVHFLLSPCPILAALGCLEGVCYLHSPCPVLAAQGCPEGCLEGGERVLALEALLHCVPEPQVLNK